MTHSRHINIPLFIPHFGCGHACVFCDQRAISGGETYRRDRIEQTLALRIASLPAGADAEIAFFGGSFTGIDREEMIALLDLAQGYIDRDLARSIRLSTRPDYISGETLKILSRYSVGTVELGIQSMSDRVLAASHRGHTAAVTRRACAMIRDAGFTLGGQMMTGLPCSEEEDERNTAAEIVSMGAAEARVYSTVVIHGTELCRMTQRGEYEPLSKEDAIRRAAEAVRIFEQSGVRLLRVGLCETASLHGDGGIAAGYYSPAFGDEVRSRIFARVIAEQIECEGIPRGASVTLEVPCGTAGYAAGHKKVNKLIILEKYGVKIAKVLENPMLLGYNIVIK